MPPEPAPQKPNSFRDKKTYIPPRLRRAIDRRSQASGEQPPALDPFAQNTSDPTFNLPRQSNSYHAATPAEPAVPPSTQTQPPAPTVNPQASPYDFMMSSPKPAASKFSLPGIGASLPARLLLGAGGLLVVVIVLIILKNLLGGGSNFTPFVAVAQDQQELIHLTTTAQQQQQQGLSVASQNFAATTQAAVGSSQTALISYLANNHQKIKSKILNLKVSSAIDNQLQAAVAASTYDQAFQQTMKTELTTYGNDLSHAYNQTKGAKGHALLSSDYKQAQLLITQLTNTGQ